MIDPSVLPAYGGSPATYMEFVAIGIAMTAFVCWRSRAWAMGYAASRCRGRSSRS